LSSERQRGRTEICGDECEHRGPDEVAQPRTAQAGDVKPATLLYRLGRVLVERRLDRRRVWPARRRRAARRHRPGAQPARRAPLLPAHEYPLLNHARARRRDEAGRHSTERIASERDRFWSARRVASSKKALRAGMRGRKRVKMPKHRGRLLLPVKYTYP
jgi:hypothetical protein